jgi:hypothetical protein
MNTKVITGKIRFSYLNAFQPRASQPGQEPKYSVCVLIPKKDVKTVADVKAAIEEAKKAGAATWGGKVPAGLKTPLRDGDEERDGAEYKNHWFVNCNSKLKPGFVDADGQPILSASDVKSGDYGRVSINFYAYSTNGNRGIAAGLQNLQFLEEGESLLGRSDAASDFSTPMEDFLA